MFERQRRACWSERLWAWQWPCSLHLSASHLWPCCPGEQTKWYICSVRWDKSVSWKWGFALACVTVRACVHACVCLLECVHVCVCVCVCVCVEERQIAVWVCEWLWLIWVCCCEFNHCQVMCIMNWNAIIIQMEHVIEQGIDLNLKLRYKITRCNHPLPLSTPIPRRSPCPHR